MSVHMPRSNTVAALTVTVYGPTRKLNAGHYVPLTRLSTVASAEPASATGGAVSVDANVTADTRTDVSRLPVVATMRSVAPAAMSAHRPPSYRVSADVVRR